MAAMAVRRALGVHFSLRNSLPMSKFVIFLQSGNFYSDTDGSNEFSDGVACPPPLEVEGSSPHASVVCTIPDGAGKLSREKVEVEENCLDGNVKVVLKSILKKEGIDDGVKEDRIDKGRVQWMDFLGRELVEVKEFEASDWDDSDDDENDRCLCAIQ